MAEPADGVLFAECQSLSEHCAQELRLSDRSRAIIASELV